MGRKQRKNSRWGRPGMGQRGSVSAPSLPALPKWVVRLSVVFLLASFAGLSIWEMKGDSLTSDERIHLPAGYAYWKKHEFRLNPEHPPLVKLLGAVPLLWMNLRMPPTKPISRGSDSIDLSTYQLRFGSEFLFTQDLERIVFWSRLPLVALAVLLGLVIFQWSSKLHGHPGAGLLSLFLFGLEPTMLAHSHYVTNDVALACFSTIAIFFLWRFSQDAKFRHFFLASLGLGLALASKFSAIFLVPVFFFLLFFQWPANGLATISFLQKRFPLGDKIFAAAIAALSAAFVVQASYFFSPDLLLYFKGIQAVNANHTQNYNYYIHGNFFPGGVWWYPLYALLLKIPLPTMIAIALGGIACLKTWNECKKGLIFVLLPAAVYTVAVCALADNLGVRYMIPVTPFLLVLAGRSLFVFAASSKSRILAGALALWLMVSVLRVSPNYISYFNELIGGPENGPYFLDDSNIDWGQDLERLMQYLRKHQVREAVLSYWGPTPPDYYGNRYGIEFAPWTPDMAGAAAPPAGVYAISVNYLVGARLYLSSNPGENPKVDWLARFKPADRVGYSIYIYKFSESSSNH